MDSALICALAFLMGAIVAWLARSLAMNGLKKSISSLETELSALRPKAEEAEVARAAVIDLRTALAAANARYESVGALEIELSAARNKITDLSAQNAALGAKLDDATVDRSKREEQLRESFKSLAFDVLKENSVEFARRADEVFKNHKDLTAAEVEKRTKEMSDLIKPLGESLKAYETSLQGFDKVRIEGFTKIDLALQDVSRQNTEVKSVAQNLAAALRTSPKTRGRWGEETLRRVMELSGMVEHCDFETEQHYPGEDESIRPDVIINLAGGRIIVVDAKTPTAAYLDAVEAATDEEREAALLRHAQQFRARLTNLSSKNYQDKIAGSADCVVMFVPGENFVSAALERDRELFEDGINNKVLICTPTTFIGLAKALSYGWRQEKLAEGALQIAKLGRELYSRLASFGDHIVDLGRHLDGAAKKYNSMVGSIEGSVMPQARRFNDLGVEGTSTPLPETKSVDTVVRFPKPNRDLAIGSSNSET